MSSVRLRRLASDQESLVGYVKRHPRLRLIQFDGDPAERYQIGYRIKSLRQIDDHLVPAKDHVVEISLPRNYPRTPPQCRMLSPVFHPNIAPHAICVGDHWSAGESLMSIAMRIGEILSYQSYNVKSPLNGDAARWVEGHEADLPLDPVSMILEDDDVTTPPTPPKPTPSPPTASPAAPSGDSKILAACPQCQKPYRVPAKWIGRSTTCVQCQTRFSVVPSRD